MKCDEFLKKICEELAEDCNSELCGEIKRHLDNCPDCQTQIQAMRATVNLFRALKQDQVPLAIHDRLIKLLNL